MANHKLQAGLEVVETPRSEHLGQILELWMRGRTYRQIADTLGITKQKVETTMHSFRTDYLSTLALNGMVPRYASQQEIVDTINKPFYELLSPSDSVLTNEEALYCALYISTGNSVDSVIRSGLDIGLKVNERSTAEIYSKNCLIRSEFLKRKKNIQEEIRRLRMEKQEMIDLTKDHLLAMQMEYIEQLKDEGDPKNKSLIVKMFDHVNKMTGSYTQVQTGSKISADDVLDAMKEVFDQDLPPELQPKEEVN